MQENIFINLLVRIKKHIFLYFRIKIIQKFYRNQVFGDIIIYFCVFHLKGKSGASVLYITFDTKVV